VNAEPGDHALGLSRGGLSTKLHLAAERGQRLLSLVLTGGQRGDAPQFEAVMAGIDVPRLGPGRSRTRPEWLHTYNHHRGHTALRGQPPASRVPNLTGQNT
jgi:hypothetical protein